MELNYYALWRLMADLIRDLKRKGAPITPDMMSDLRLIKSMIEILKIDRSNMDVIRRIEECMSNLESRLIPMADEYFGREYAEALMDKIAEARRSRVSEPELEMRLRIGAPRDKDWIRIKPTDMAPPDMIRELCERFGLKHETQSDGYMLIYGDKESIKRFIKETARRIAK